MLSNDAADTLPESRYAKLPAELRATLERSFADRVAGRAHAESNLMFGFPANQPPPATLSEATGNLGPMAVNLLVRLFERMQRCDPTLATWKQIKYVRNLWWGGSAGMKVVYHQAAAMRACLDGLFDGASGNRIARDTFVGAAEHQARPVANLAVDAAMIGVALAGGDPPDCDTWRELVGPGEEALHFCVGRSDLQTATGAGGTKAAGARAAAAERRAELDDIHIDWSSPVNGIDVRTRRCTYAPLHSVAHWAQAKLGANKPVFTFDEIERHLESGRARAAGPGSGVLAKALGDLDLRWNQIKWDLALSGRRGYDASLAYYREALALTR